MPEQWKMICRLKDMPQGGARMVQRGLAWQDLPGVALFRAADDTVYALLDTVPCLGGPLAHGVLISEHVPLSRKFSLRRLRFPRGRGPGRS